MRIKKWMAWLLIISLIVVNGAAIAETAEETAEVETNPRDFEYEVMPDGSASIKAYLGMQTAISIPEMIDGHVVRCIGKLEDSSSVTTVSIPSTVTEVEGNPFALFYALETISVSRENVSFMSENGVLYTADREKLVCYPRGRGGDGYRVSQETRVIGERAFCGCSDLVYIEIPDGVQTIEADAFLSTDGFTDVFIPGSVEQIEANPFRYSCGLSNILVDPQNPYYYAQDGVLFNRTEKALQAFPHNKMIDGYRIPEGILAIGRDAFSRHEGYGSVVFPQSLKRIDDFAFYNCAGMTFPELLSGIEYVGELAFNRCKAIETVTIEKNASVQLGAFEYCSNLTMAVIEEGNAQIADSLFHGCESLAYVSLPSTLTSIGDYAFNTCKSLRQLIVPAAVEHIGERAFAGCPNLTVLVEAGSYAEAYCEANGVPYAHCDGTEIYGVENVYVDKLSKTFFALPEGWKQVRGPEMLPFIDATFTPSGAENTFIYFICEDPWMELDEEERTALILKGHLREDLTNEDLKPEKIAGMFGQSAEDVCLVSYSGQEFFSIDMKDDRAMFGAESSTELRVLLCINNGYLYFFMLSSSGEADSHYPEFEALLDGICWG